MKGDMKGYDIRIRLYAGDEEEARELERAAADFIERYRTAGIPVTAGALTKAIREIAQRPIAEHLIKDYLCLNISKRSTIS